MLRSLRIRDFALIRTIEMEPSPGLNLLTGETGSGKSIVVDALGLLVGGRSSPEMIRTGCEAAILEATFGFDRSGPVARILDGAGISCEEDSLLIRREISSSGKSRVFLNDSLTTLTLLRGLGDSLADIHSQQDQASLLEPTAQLDWLDRFGKNTDLVSPVRSSYRKLVDIYRQLESLRMDEQERLRRVDVLEFQINEIRRASLLPHEKEELGNERNVLANREKIFALATEAYGLLHEHEPSLIALMRRIEHILVELGSYDSKWGPQREALAESLYTLEDLADAMRDYTTRLEFTPERLDQVEQRLADLDRLGRKYGDSYSAIISYAEKSEQQLQQLLSHADMTKQLTEQFEAEITEYRTLSDRLTERRRREALRLEHQIRAEFEALAMEKMELQVQFAPRVPVEPSSGLPTHYGPTGMDYVEFMIAPNKGEDMKPLTKIASGGELSRIMLAIKSLCGGGEAGKTLVFDEVDAGIGGRVAEAVGKRLRSLAESNQVLCVTHLPQIAAFAQHHFNVSKESAGGRTETRVVPLDANGKVEELARMLGGRVITDIARRHAREMLEYTEKHAARKPEKAHGN